MEHGREEEGKSLRVLIAAAHGHVAAKCLATGCPADQRLRDRFGCDGPTGNFGVDCTCGGERRACPYCRGTGQERVYRCPRWHSKVRGLERFLVVLRRVKRYRELPIAGGILAQANVYLEAADVVDRAEGAARERERRKER